MEKFTRRNVTETLKKIIEDRGADHVEVQQTRTLTRQGCFYTYPRKNLEPFEPACIVGHLIHRLAPEVLQDIGVLEEEQNTSCEAGSLAIGSPQGWSDADGNMPELPTLTDDLTLAESLAAMQNAQDIGSTWGEAFEEFLSELANPANLR